MNRGVKAWQLPPRLITGAYFLNAGLSKRDADDATAPMGLGLVKGVAGLSPQLVCAVVGAASRAGGVRRPQPGSRWSALLDERP